MQRERIMIEIAMDLDPIPGAFHTEEDARLRVQAMLLTMMPHYNPVVLDK